MCKNLWQGGGFDEHQNKISEFFPRCYDLADTKQIADFINDFNQTVCLSIITIIAKHLINKNPNLKSLYLEFQSKVAQFSIHKVYKAQFKQKCKGLDPSGKARKGLAGHESLRFSYYFAKNFCS